MAEVDLSGDGDGPAVDRPDVVRASLPDAQEGPTCTAMTASNAAQRDVNGAVLRIADIVPGVAFADAALAFHAAGFRVIPIDPGTKVTVVKWDEWLGKLSPGTIAAYWATHPGHELGCIVDDRLLVLDTDSPASSAAVVDLERAFGIESNFVVKTRRGEHRYYRLADGAFARTNVHSTEAHPERIDVKARRSMVILPPSTNKTIAHCSIDSVAELTIVGQDFVDAVFRHNGREPPREIQHAEPRPTSFASDDVDQKLVRLRVMLEKLDPDCAYDEWYRILMALHHETGGSEDGLALADAWSARGRTYCGEHELRMKWRTFEGYSGTPVTEGTLRAMLRKQGEDLTDVVAAAEPQFEPCDFETVDVTPRPASDPAHGPTLTPTTDATAGSQPALSPELVLTAYSLTGSLKKLKREMVEQRRLLDGIALLGQATAIYSAPNVGKTLLMLWLLMQAIRLGRIDSSLVFYINCDDSLSGLVTKLEFVEAHGFHMVAEGHNDFEAKAFVRILQEVMRRGQARGLVVILDTAKKFFDQMDKRIGAGFGKVMRRFVMQGGTVILLSHVNKRPGPDGRPIYSGTSDLVEDVDCAYTLRVISEPGAAEKVVEFENIKRRGDVVQRAVFAYSAADGLSYERLLASVRPVNDAEAVVLEMAAELRTDVELIAATRDCIGEGIVKRMDLIAAIARRSKCGRRKAEQLLDKYTGDDPLQHHWTYDVGPRGAKLYRVLEPSGATTAAAAASASTPREAGHE